MNAAQLLSIPLSKPNMLFPKDSNEAKKLHRSLSSEWHPDRNTDPQASQVLAHINALFDEAEKLLAKGTWPSSYVKTNEAGENEVMFLTKEQRSFKLTYLRHRAFELGDVYSSMHYVTYVIRPEFNDLAEHALRAIKFKYLTKEFEKEHSRYLPRLHVEHTLSAGERMIVFKKTPDVYMLQDIIDSFNGSMEPRHMAWMLSALYNINCYLKIAGITHNDISPLTVFINAPKHEALLLGGWWYSGREGKKPLAVPARTRNVSKDFTTKAVDAALIRLTGREICGSQLLKAPPEIQRWVRGLGTDDSVKEYMAWHKMLETAFGPRKFATLELPETIY